MTNLRNLVWVAVVLEAIAIVLLARVSREMAHTFKRFERKAVAEMRRPEA